MFPRITSMEVFSKECAMGLASVVGTAREYRGYDDSHAVGNPRHWKEHRDHFNHIFELLMGMAFSREPAARSAHSHTSFTSMCSF